MTTHKATLLATILGGQLVPAMPQSRLPGVSMTLADGRYLILDEDAGALYQDEPACWLGDGTGLIDAWEWGSWGVTEDWASGLSAPLGADAYQSGGNIWVVLYDRPDGRYVVIGDDGAEVYRNRDHYERYYEGGQPEPERVDWSNMAT